MANLAQLLGPGLSLLPIQPSRWVERRLGPCACYVIFIRRNVCAMSARKHFRLYGIYQYIFLSPLTSEKLLVYEGMESHFLPLSATRW